MLREKKYQILTIAVIILALMILACFALAHGQIKIPWQHTIAVILDKIGLGAVWFAEYAQEEQAVIWYIRLPRVIVAILVGAALGISGAVMQGIFSNPLASPGIIGVSSGAATGAVLSIAMGAATYNMFIMPVFALGGSLTAVVLTVFLAIRNGKVPVMPLLLAGVAVGMLLGAVTSAVLLLMSEQQMQQYLFWMVGGLDYRRWEHVQMALGPVLSGIIIMLLLSRHLNILALGETEAKAVGMNVTVFRLSLLFLASVTTAASVCVSGNIGFVGLVIPHMMRMVIGLERGAYTINNPHVSLVFEKGDLLWLLGKQKLLTSLTREGVL